MAQPVVGIVTSARADLEVMERAARQLEELGVAYTLDVLSVHHDPAAVARWVETARERGLRVLIAGASRGGHLPGVVAAYTTLPVIGVPCLSRHLGGADALYGVVQMPVGVPVATVGLDAAENAAILAAQILAVADDALTADLDRVRAGHGEDRRAEHREWTGEAPKGSRFGFQV